MTPRSTTEALPSPPIFSAHSTLSRSVDAAADELVGLARERLRASVARVIAMAREGSTRTLALKTDGPDGDPLEESDLVLLDRLRAEPRTILRLETPEAVSIGVSFPLPGPGGLIGVLTLRRSGGQGWTDEEATHVDLLGRLAASELERAYERESRNQARALVEAQNRVLRSIGSGAPLAQTLDVLCRRVEKLLGDARCAVFVADPDSGILRPQATGTLPDAFRARFPELSPADAGHPAALAAREGRVVVVPSVDEDREFRAFHPLAESLGIGACWAAPVRGESDAPLGVFACHYAGPRTPTARELDLVEALGRTTGVAIEHARAGEALRQSEARFRDLVETSSDYIWEMDENGVNVYSSPQIKQMMGFDPEEVVGMTPTDPMSSDERDRLSSVYESIIASRKPFHCLENVNITKDGRTVVLETSGVPIFDEQGRFRGYRGIDRDITERKRLEEQLRTAQKMEAVGRLAGGVAHDFNNLLTAIRGHAELMAGDIPADDPLREDLDEIRRASDRASSLTTQLLAFSRRQVLQPVVTDLRGVVTSVRRMLDRLLPAHVQLRLDLSSSASPVRVDPARMEQVIMNLALNASDALPDGGVITIRTFEERVEEADVPGREADLRSGSYVVLEVEDDGVGMTHDVRAKIFEPFFTTKPRGKASGLGLSMVYGIVRQSGGAVRVESAVDRGSRFRVYLPRVSGATTSIPADDEVGSLDGDERVLLVEDERAVRTLVRKALERHGYEVVEAEDGAAGLEAWSREDGAFDLLLTDVVMPGMSGPDLAAELRGQRSGLPVLFMSGYAEEGVLREGALDPDVNLLEKPFAHRELLVRVRKALAG